MRIAFMGTPPFAVRALAELVAAGHEVAMVYTQPAAPRGRGQQMTPTAVGLFAMQLGLPVRTPASMRDPDEIEFFKGLDLDAAVVVAYGQILPREVLEAPRHGSFNLHASLLPRWRGAAPIQRAVMAGDRATGVQVMRMTEGLDEGPVLASEAVAIAADDTAGSLHDKLMEAGGPLVARTLAAVEKGTAVELPQAEGGVTYARKVSSAEAKIDWTRPAVEVDRHIRGLSPFPGAWFMAESSRGPVRVKALLSRVGFGEGEPGKVLDDMLLVGCGEGAVRLLNLQREGKGPQASEEFLRGLPIPAGAKLG